MNPLFDILGITQPIWSELTAWVTTAARLARVRWSNRGRRG